MTFFLNRLSFIYPIRDFVDKVVANDGVRFDFVEEWVLRIVHLAWVLHLTAFFSQNTQEPDGYHRPPISLLSSPG
jgi:hypothetical protein